MRTLWTCLFLIPTLLAPAKAAEEPLRAGIAVVDITPPIPYRMSGYFSERVSTGIKDPLKAKAVVFAQGDAKAALVFCDLIGISPGVARRARATASQMTGINPHHIAVAATHSHTGPLYAGALRKHFHDRSVAASGHDPYEQIDYPTQLVSRLAKCIDQADANLQPISLRAGYIIERNLSFNRRFHMRDGTVRFNPGQQNPNIARAAGPIDPQVGTIALYAPGSTSPLAAIVSFALHLDTIGGTQYSADYPYWLQHRLRREFGSQFTCLFGTGTCGDINHIDVRIQGRRSAEEIGRQLGSTMVAGWDQLAAVEHPRLGIVQSAIDVPLQQYSDERIARAREDMAQVDSPQVGFLDRVATYKIMDLQLRDGTQIPLEVQAFRLSPDVAIVTLPGEVFVELGIAIKSASPFTTTLVIELTNDAPGYLPTRKAFAEGSYETVNSRIAPGGAEKMVETATRLLHELH